MNLLFFSAFCLLFSASHADLIERCFDDLGCFGIGGDFFHPIWRPINLLPQSRETINTRFLLFTQNNKDKHIEFKGKRHPSIVNSTFNATNPTKFIVHGFIDNLEWTTDFMQVMKDALLEDDPSLNVFLVDWSGGNHPPYTQASANARVVGAEIAFFIKELQTLTSAKLSSIHIIAHSLGAHVASYAGMRFNGSLARITGLAPAGPFFDHMPNSVRLDPSDAKFVDAIHSDRRELLFGLGTVETTGHVAFYPNGGHQQPHCDLNRKVTKMRSGSGVDGIRNFALCDHQQAVDFYIEAIRNKRCTPIAYQCDSYYDYVHGKCDTCTDTKLCNILGPKSIDIVEKKAFKPQMKFYLKMGPEEHHYCVEQYLLSIELDNHPSRISHVQHGNLTVVLHTDKGEGRLDYGEPHDYDHPSTTKYVATTSQYEVRNITQLHVSWTYIRDRISDPFKDHHIYIKNIIVEPLSITDEKTKKEETRKFCMSDAAKGLGTQRTVNFNLC